MIFQWGEVGEGEGRKKGQRGRMGSVWKERKGKWLREGWEIEK